MYEVREVTDTAERDAVFRLRYEVFVREQGIVGIPTADHTAGTIIDEADRTGAVFVARVDGELVGAVRVNLLRHGPAEPYTALLALPRNEYGWSSVTGRLFVTKPHRTGCLGIRLAQACYRYVSARGVQQDFIMVKQDFVPFYRRLGYDVWGAEVASPGVGLWTPLRVDVVGVASGSVRSVLASGRPLPPRAGVAA